jgi:hypothetical protein
VIAIDLGAERPAVRRAAVTGLAAVGIGLAGALALAIAGPRLAAGLPAAGPVAVGAIAAAGLSIGAWQLVRLRRLTRARRERARLRRLLAPHFDDSYTLLGGLDVPALGSPLDALLVGPPGVRVLQVRRWDGHYRVRGRAWEYDTRGPQGWIACRTNPTAEALLARDALRRWLAAAGIDERAPIEAVPTFPERRTKLTLEEPETEVLTADNATWWAQRIGRVQRLDRQRATRLVSALIERGGYRSRNQARGSAASG